MSLTGRTYWKGVLAAGGSTAVPRWTLHPTPGVAELRGADPRRGRRGAASRRSAVPLRTVLLAAHAVVLAALAGEREVVVGYVAGAGSRPLPCPLTTEPVSWRELVRETHRAESELLRYADFPVDDLRRELGVTGPSFETVFDPAGERRRRVGVPLQVGDPRPGGRAVLRLRYRTDAVDAACAARVAGYHLAALALIAADPDAPHREQNLLSAEERRFQLEGLAGARRELPDRRFHELFEERVRRHPHAVAAVHGDREWTYGELNARANRIGRALLARGLRREGVVAVVTERDLDWMAAVIGGVQGRRGVPARRAALPGRADRHHAVAGGLHAWC